MVSHRDVAQAFANRETLKGSNMFVEGNAVYSYGRHFPIAVWTSRPYTVLFNKDGYSSSTTRHKNYVRAALAQVGVDMIEVDTRTMKEASGDSSANVVIVRREPEDLRELFEITAEFLKRKGVRRIDDSDRQQLLAHVRKLLVVENL